MDVRDQENRRASRALIEEVRTLREQTTALLDAILRKAGRSRADAVRLRSWQEETALCWTAMLRALACFAIAVAAGAVFALTASGTLGARCQPTLSDAAGPFQQSGVNAPRRAKIGTGHVLQGRVVAPNCAPVARALVVFWQAGPNGTARTARQCLHRPRGEISHQGDLSRRPTAGSRTSTSPSSTQSTRSS